MLFRSTIGNGAVTDTSATACKTFTWDRNGQTYNTTGTYDVTIPNGVCIDTVRLHLTINNPAETDTLVTACKTFTWDRNGQTYNTSRSEERRVGKGCSIQTVR